MHFFTEQDKLSAPTLLGTDHYGPEISTLSPNITYSSSIFNTTSRFQLTNEAKAYACEDAKMIVQQSIEDDSLVNIILRPISVNKEVNIDVKYYVYRGIKKSSLFNVNNDYPLVDKFYQIKPLPTPPILCTDVVSDFYKPKLEIPKKSTPPSPPYYAKHFGYDRVINIFSGMESNLLADNVTIESIFEGSQTSIGINPIIVNEGDWIGTFATTHKIGFEILLNTNRFTVDLGYVRADKHQIIIPSGLTDFAKKAKREEILYFIDPAAFFGAYHKKGVKAVNISEKCITPLKKPTDDNDLYSKIISKFATKNKVYLDIRSEKGYSYNFYGNYNDGNNKNFQIRHSSVYEPIQEYQDNHWPIIIMDTAISSTNTINKLKFKLRIDDNTEPILYFSNEYFLGAKSKYVRSLEEIVDTTTTPPTTTISTTWSREIGVRFPSVGSLNLASYIKAYYFREKHNATEPPPPALLRNEFYYDSAFCSIDIPNIGTNLIKSKSVISVDETYIREPLHEPLIPFTTDPDYNAIPKYGTSNFAFNAETGAFWDNNRILFYSKAVSQNKKTEQFYSKNRGVENKISLDSKYFKLSFLTNMVNINCKVLQEKLGLIQYTLVKSISISHFFRNYVSFFSEKENLLLLGIKTDELQLLIDAADEVDPNTQLPKLSDKHHRYLFLEEYLPSPKTDKDGILFRKFKLKVQGITQSGESSIIAPDNDISLYTRDGLCFTSKEFAEYETVSTISNARRGDRGKAILEINIRLAGFGGLLPTEDFTEMTERGVKQFQRDYMNMENPTGVADIATLMKIDEFCEIYRENVDNYKCPCNKCGGFGKGQFKNKYLRTSRIERWHKYEYPGMHQSLLWAVSASRFYFTKKLNGEYSIESIDSGYRCWVNNNNKVPKRESTNHMGKAVDLHFNKNGARFKSDMDLLREKIYCDYIGAPKQGGSFGWLSDKFGLEPKKFTSGEKGATTWVHLDVREFNRVNYLKDEFFIKSNNEMNFNRKICEINN